MGKIQTVEPVKLFSGFIARSIELISTAEEDLSKKFGPIDFQSPVIPFSFTDYYQKEMGKSLLRKWVSFEKLISPDELSGIKVFTNDMEKKYSVSNGRSINIDPGYINLSKIVLASTKDFSHRIYLSNGIFAEITMIYKQKYYTDLPWTYPDYKSKNAMDFLAETRSIFAKQLKDAGNA